MESWWIHQQGQHRERVHVEFLKPGSGDGGIEVNTLVERVNLDGSLSGGRESPLSPLACSPQSPKCSGISADILLVFPLELRHEVVHKPVIKKMVSP